MKGDDFSPAFLKYLEMQFTPDEAMEYVEKTREYGMVILTDNSFEMNDGVICFCCGCCC